MHDSVMSQVEMDHENVPTTHDSGYGNSDGGWMGGMSNVAYTSPQQHQSAVFENQGYNFMTSNGHHGMPMEPPYLSPRLPPTSHHQMLQPLIMPSHPTWPSELVSNSATSYSEPIQPPAPPVPAPVVKGNANKLPSLIATHAPNPRKTLTDDDRRRMCQYSDENPHVKQTDIGALFGVERSTVSKVLRQKEKYLYPSERTTTPVKRAGKGKIIDIDRGLLSWWNNQKKLGIDVSDTALADKARYFALSVGDQSQGLRIGSASWIQKFKHKNGINNGKLTRRASTTNISEMSSRSMTRSSSSTAQTPNNMSPLSPSILPSPSPLSAAKSDDEKADSQGNSYFSYAGVNKYKHSNSHSTTSLSSVYTDGGPTLFSAGPTSPTTPFTFSPDQASAPWQSSQQRYPLPSNLVRPRSQTFPTLDSGFISTQAGELMTPKYNGPSTEASSAILDSPMHEIAQPFTIDTAVSSPSLHRSASNGSMGPPSSVTPLSGAQSAPATAAPSDSATEELRKAMDTLLTLIHQTPSSFSDSTQDYTSILNWAAAERLRTQHNNALPILPGGLHQILEHDYDPGEKVDGS